MSLSKLRLSASLPQMTEAPIQNQMSASTPLVGQITGRFGLCFSLSLSPAILLPSDFTRCMTNPCRHLKFFA